VIIPDAIEPVEGWKVLDIKSEGATAQFCSPSNIQYWPFKQAMQARCNLVAHRWRWIVSTDERPTTDAEIEVMRNMPTRDAGVPSYTSSASVNMYQSFASSGSPPLVKDTLPNHLDHVPDRPRIELVYGNWVLRRMPDPHETPEDHCRCGIYMVDDVDEAFNYGHKLKALVRVKGWGKTIPGAKGARVEKAYPTAIYTIGWDANALLPDLMNNYGITDGYTAYNEDYLRLHLLDPRHALDKTPGVAVAAPVGPVQPNLIDPDGNELVPYATVPFEPHRTPNPVMRLINKLNS